MPPKSDAQKTLDAIRDVVAATDMHRNREKREAFLKVRALLGMGDFPVIELGPVDDEAVVDEPDAAPKEEEPVKDSEPSARNW